MLGGSGGSQTLNQQVPLALYKAGAALHDWQIVHQTGERDVAATGELYRKLGICGPPSRRSSRTCRSCCAPANWRSVAPAAPRWPNWRPAGCRRSCCPIPRATDDHQRKNADVFAAAGAAMTLDERELHGRLDNHLASAIVELATAIIRCACGWPRP